MPRTGSGPAADSHVLLEPDPAPGRVWPALAAITLLALAVRLPALGGKSLWIDEAHSFYFATQSLPDIFSRLCDPHPPGYYALLHAVLSWGRSEFWLRLPSAVAGTLTVPALYLLGAELAGARPRRPGRGTATLAALLLAVAPLHVWYSREARMYALVTFLGVCAAYLAVRFAQRRDAVAALGYLVAASAALLVDQSAALPLLVANLLWAALWVRRRREAAGGRRELVPWLGLQLGVALPWGLWWSRALYPSLFSAGTLYQLPMVRQLLQRIGWSVSVSDLERAFAVGLLLCVAAGAGLGWWLLRRGGARRLAPALAPLGVVLFLLLTVGSAVPRLFTVKRLLLGLLPFFLLYGAWALREFRPGRRSLFTVVALSLSLSVVTVLWGPAEPWREAVAQVQGALVPADVLWVDELAVPAFDYYAGGSHARHVWRAEGLYAPGRATGAGRLWLVAATNPYRNLLDHLPPSWEPAQGYDWHRIGVRAYGLPLPETNSPSPQDELPAWLLAWPSPLDPACEVGGSSAQ